MKNGSGAPDFLARPFKGSRRKAFNGLCVAIVQSTAKPGRIQLTATSSGLKSSSVAITTKT